ncbi:MAG TPA: hypothetical protein VKF32_08270 [Thermoanaerobaculia bacterium]|nr:hypothetical protein [Thermoanaerobaculia bacterium]
MRDCGAARRLGRESLVVALGALTVTLVALRVPLHVRRGALWVASRARGDPVRRG